MTVFYNLSHTTHFPIQPLPVISKVVHVGNVPLFPRNYFNSPRAGVSHFLSIPKHIRLFIIFFSFYLFLTTLGFLSMVTADDLYILNNSNKQILNIWILFLFIIEGSSILIVSIFLYGTLKRNLFSFVFIRFSVGFLFARCCIFLISSIFQSPIFSANFFSDFLYNFFRYIIGLTIPLQSFAFLECFVLASFLFLLFSRNSRTYFKLICEFCGSERKFNRLIFPKILVCEKCKNSTVLSSPPDTVLRDN